MARPRQDGLLYFSFDTDFFYADQRIKRLHSRYGSDGMLFFIYLLTEIYRNGYYIRWDGESVDNAMDDLHLTEGLIEQVMAFLVSRSLLVKRTLVGSDTAITSPGIQKRYQEAIKSRKRDVYVDADIWLLDENETASFIKVTGNVSKSCGNENKSCGNKSKSCGNDIKESKGKESKENKRKENKRKEKDIPRAEKFEDFWAAYPNKQRRYQAEKAYCDLILSGAISEPELVASAVNYAEYVRESGDKMYLPNNFLEKCIFSDYLEAKPESGLPKVIEPEAEEELIDDEEWWKYGPNAWEG